MSALPLFILFPSWAFIEAFYSILPAVSLGLFTAVCAAYFTRELNIKAGDIHKRPKAVFAILACLVVSIGCYQSFVMLYFAIGTGCTLLSFWQRDASTPPKVSPWAQLAPFALFSLTGSFLSVLAGKTIQISLGIPRSSYLDHFLRPELQSPTAWPFNLLSIAKAVITYFGGWKVYGDWFICLPFLTLAACIILVASKGRLSHKKRTWTTLMLFILLISSPFLFSLVGGVLPTRSLLALPYVAWLLSVIVITSIQRKPRSIMINTVLASLLALTAIQSLYINGVYNAASFLVGRHDSLLAASIYNRLNTLNNDGDSTKPIFLGISGRANYASPFHTGWGSTIGASIFDWDGGEPYRMIAYMNLLGYSRIRTLDYSVVRSRSEEIKAMKTWPSPGSLVKIGRDKYLLKLSDN